MSVSQDYINALNSYAKAKKEIFGNADFEFAESEITAFEAKDIALMLHQLHLVATGDVDPDLIVIPIKTRSEAKARFASIFTCVVAHITLSETKAIDIWLKSFVEGILMTGSTGGAECVFASMLANASPNMIEESIASWRSLESDPRHDAEFPISVALSPGGKDLFVLEPDIRVLLREKNRLDTNVFSNDLSRLSNNNKYSLTTDQCKSVLKLAGAIGGGLAGGEFVAGYAIGSIVADVYCPFQYKSDAPAKPDKPDKPDTPSPKPPEPDDKLGMVVDPDALDYRTGLANLHGITSRSVYLRGPAVDTLLQNFGHFNDTLKKVSMVASLRATLLLAKPQLKTFPAIFPNAKLMPSKIDNIAEPALQKDRTESYEFIDNSIPVFDNEGNAVAWIPNGFNVNFAPGSGAAALYPNGFSFTPDVPEDVARKFVAKILEEAKIVLPGRNEKSLSLDKAQSMDG